jgi:hypothetical protein
MVEYPMLMTRAPRCRTMRVRSKPSTHERSEPTMTVLYYRGIPADVWRAALAPKRSDSTVTATVEERRLGEVVAVLASRLAHAA